MNRKVTHPNSENAQKVLDLLLESLKGHGFYTIDVYAAIIRLLIELAKDGLLSKEDLLKQVSAMFDQYPESE